MLRAVDTLWGVDPCVGVQAGELEWRGGDGAGRWGRDGLLAERRQLRGEGRWGRGQGGGEAKPHHHWVEVSHDVGGQTSVEGIANLARGEYS